MNQTHLQRLQELRRRVDEEIKKELERLRRLSAHHEHPGGAPAEIRAWALERGLNVAERGRIGVDIQQAYRDAHNGTHSESP